MTSFFIGPIVGGIIGYITNSIAIKMLFRPLKPIYIRGKRVPFTPGMIPREQARIAKTIGLLIQEELIDTKLLKEYLLSQEMYFKIEGMIDQWFKENKYQDKTVREFLEELTSEKTVEQIQKELEAKLTETMQEKVKKIPIAEPIVEETTKVLKDSIGPLSMFVGEGFIESAKGKLKEIIEQMIEEKSEPIISGYIEENVASYLERPMSEVVEGLESEIHKIKYIILKHYKKFVESHLTEVLTTINLSKIIEEKIKNYEAKQMERLIFNVVNRELKAIVWLGALLGGIMGFVMNFF